MLLTLKRKRSKIVYPKPKGINLNYNNANRYVKVYLHCYLKFTFASPAQTTGSNWTKHFFVHNCCNVVTTFRAPISKSDWFNDFISSRNFSVILLDDVIEILNAFTSSMEHFHVTHIFLKGIIGESSVPIRQISINNSLASDICIYFIFIELVIYVYKQNALNLPHANSKKLIIHLTSLILKVKLRSESKCWTTVRT